MSSLLFSIYVGIGAGILDIIPMLFKRLSSRSILSAFFQYLFVSVVILNIDLPIVPWWIEGVIISFMFAIPIVLAISGKDQKSAPIILLNSIFMGILITLAGKYLR